MTRFEPSKIVGAAFFIATIAAPVPLCAATDGTLGPNSTGTFQANLTVLSPAESSVQVTGLEDIVLNTTTASNAVQYVGGSTSACLNMTNPGNVFGAVEVQPGPASVGNLSDQFSLTIAPKS